LLKLLKLFLGFTLLIAVGIALPATAQSVQASTRRFAACTEEGISPYEAWVKDLPCLPVHLAQEVQSPESILETGVVLPQASLPSLANYTYLVFESLRDGNYEIYGSKTPWDEDGVVSPTRMTTHSAKDTRPKLRPGSTQVIFTSNRSGFYELYLMDWGGGNLWQLTSTKTYASQPAWSPNGSQIAFVSEVDKGNLEIMVMKADGSGLTRLTNKDSADFNPSWSPDGARLVWVRALDDEVGVLYTMNTDGSNQQAITGAYLEAGNPAWSKDGTQISFDCDYNRDGYLDVVKVTLGGSGVTPVLSGTSQHDYWAGPWTSIIGKELLYTQITYPTGGGLYACLGALNISTGSAGCLANSNYLDFYPDAAPVDLSVPETRALPLPEYSPASGFGVTVTGRDPGLAGIYAMYLQYRRGLDGVWLDWWYSPPTTQYTFSFSNPAGSMYYFRSSGLDWAEHREPYPTGNGDAQTLLYSWQLAGLVVDSRGHGIAEAEALTDPVFFDQQDADAYGQFHRFVPASSVTVTLSSLGYDPLPDTVFSSQNDLTYRWALPPLDDQLVNGNFEASLEAWTISSDEDVRLDDELSHSGTASALLNRTIPVPPSMLAGSSDSLNATTVAMLSQVVTIPDTLHKPTLSFFASALQDSLEGEFGVQVNGTVVYRLAEMPAGWEQAWVDLSGWSGETVILTFYLANDLAIGLTQVHLDDITLGSWLSPVVDSVLPAEVRAGEPLKLSITGENFIATPGVRIGALEADEVKWINAHTLQVSIPEGLAPGRYAVRVINPSGHAGVWSELLKVGEVLYLPTAYK
jgi:hypothetical protein